jgi:hypothetical protein
MHWTSIVCCYLHGQAEEQIKQEMLVMMHYDAVHSPTPAQLGLMPGKKGAQQPSQKSVVSQAQHMAYLEQHPYRRYEEKDLEKVCVITCARMLLAFKTTFILALINWKDMIIFQVDDKQLSFMVVYFKFSALEVHVFF